MLPKYILAKIVNYVMLTHNVINLKRVCKMWRKAVNYRFYNCKKMSQLILKAATLLDVDMINYLNKRCYDLSPYYRLLKIYNLPRLPTVKIYKFEMYMELWCKTIPANIFYYMHNNNLLKEKHYKFILEYNSDLNICKTAAFKLASSGRTCVQYPEIPCGTLIKLIKISPRILHRIIKTNIYYWNKNDNIVLLLNIINDKNLINDIYKKYKKIFNQYIIT